jgi:hypothetical protein
MAAAMAGRWAYPAELLDGLTPLGLRPTPATPPELARQAADDLYRYELRRLRDRLRRGEVDRASFLARVVQLRKKYWVLTLPLAAWLRICTTSTPPSPG